MLHFVQTLEREEIAELVFAHLDHDNIQVEISILAQVCRCLFDVTRRPSLWKHLYCNRWPNQSAEILTESEFEFAVSRLGWRQLYINRHIVASEKVDWKRYASGGEIRLRGHREFITALAKCGDSVYSGSLDGNIRQWDKNTLICVRLLQDNSPQTRRSPRVWTMAAIWGGASLASGHGDGLIRLWDLEAGLCRCRVGGHRGEVNTIAAVSGSMMISGSDDWTLRVWTFRPAAAAAVGVLPSAVEEEAIVEEDAGGQACDGAPEGGETHEGGEALEEEGNLGADHGGGGVGGGEAEAGPGGDVSCRWVLRGHTDKVYCVCAWRGVAASGSVDASVRLWDLRRGTLLRVLLGHANAVTARILIHGRRLISCSRDRTIRLWDAAGDSWACLRVLHPFRPAPTDSDAPADASAGGSEGEDSVVANEGGGAGRAIGVQRVYCMVVSGDQLVGGAADVADDLGADCRYDLRVWDLQTMRCLHILPQPAGNEVYALLAPWPGEVWAGVGTDLVVWGRLPGTAALPE